MERLTMIDGCGNDELVRCMDCSLEKAGENLENCGFCEERWQKALKKLTAYEDTGLEPEDLALGLDAAVRRKAGAEYYGLSPDQMDVAVDLFRADKDGRVVVLPCKVGDEATWIHDGITRNCRVHRIQVNRRGTYIILKSTCVHGAFPIEQIGKTVFLTREAAEKALKEAERND